MSKHTPGPWWRDDDGFIAAGSGESYVTIADPHCSGLDIDEREANTSLITAAPELLAACLLFLKTRNQQYGSPLCEETLNTAREAAQEAVEKAVGKPYDGSLVAGNNLPDGVIDFIDARKQALYARWQFCTEHKFDFEARHARAEHDLLEEILIALRTDTY